MWSKPTKSRGMHLKETKSYLNNEKRYHFAYEYAIPDGKFNGHIHFGHLDKYDPFWDTKGSQRGGAKRAKKGQMRNNNSPKLKITTFMLYETRDLMATSIWGI